MDIINNKMGHKNCVVLFALTFMSVASNTFSFDLNSFIQSVNKKTPPSTSLHLDFKKPADQNQERSNPGSDSNSFLNNMFNKKSLYDAPRDRNAPDSVTTIRTTTTTTTQRPNNGSRSQDGGDSFLQNMFNRPAMYDNSQDRNAPEVTTTSTTTSRPINEGRSQNGDNNGGSNWFSNYWYQRPSLYDVAPRQQVRSSDTGTTHRPESLQWQGSPKQQQESKSLGSVNTPVESTTENFQSTPTAEVDTKSSENSQTTTDDGNTPEVNGITSSLHESTTGFPSTTSNISPQYQQSSVASNDTRSSTANFPETETSHENTNSLLQTTNFKQIHESDPTGSSTPDFPENISSTKSTAEFQHDLSSDDSQNHEGSTTEIPHTILDLEQSRISTVDAIKLFNTLKTESTASPTTESEYNINTDADDTITTESSPILSVDNKPFHDAKEEWFYNETHIEEMDLVQNRSWADNMLDDYTTTQETTLDVESSTEDTDIPSDEFGVGSTSDASDMQTTSVSREPTESTTPEIKINIENRFHLSAPRIFEANGIPCTVPQMFAPCDYYTRCFSDVQNLCASRDYFVGDDVNTFCHVMSNVSATTEKNQLVPYLLSVQRCINDDLRGILEYPSCDEVTRLLWSSLLRKSRVSCWYQGGAFCQIISDVEASFDLAKMFIGASYQDTFMMRLLVTLGEMATYCGDHLASKFVTTLMTPLMSRNGRFPPPGMVP